MSAQQCADARIPLEYRDFCANLLIPLNECRKASFYAPWACEHEKHAYEKCQYKEYIKRVAKASDLRN